MTFKAIPQHKTIPQQMQQQNNLYEIQELFSQPAVYSNKIHIGAFDNVIRLTFSEEIPGTSFIKFRTAVALDIRSADILINLIMQFKHQYNMQKSQNEMENNLEQTKTESEIKQ